MKNTELNVAKLEALVKRKQSQVEDASQQWADRMDYGHTEREVAAAAGRLTQRERELDALTRELDAARASDAIALVQAKRAALDAVGERAALVGRQYGFTSAEYLAALAPFAAAEAELIAAVRAA